MSADIIIIISCISESDFFYSNAGAYSLDPDQARGYKTFFIFITLRCCFYHANKCKNAINFGILTFMSMIHFMLS